jgi:hypothetical protein
MGAIKAKHGFSSRPFHPVKARRKRLSLAAILSGIGIAQCRQ